jgi:excisionase family DNA binding protein
MKPDSDAMPSPIMTVRELAQYLRVHQGTLYKLIRRGQIPFFKIGADYRFNRETIERLLTHGQNAGLVPDPGSSRSDSTSSQLVRPSPLELR